MNELDGLILNKSGIAYRDILGQDRWESFTVSATITLVGTLTSVGRYRIVGASCEFQVSLVASTSIATTAGTSFIALPRAAGGIAGIATMTNDTSNIAVGVCHVDVATSRCYLPTQLVSADAFTICGSYEIGVT